MDPGYEVPALLTEVGIFHVKGIWTVLVVRILLGIVWLLNPGRSALCVCEVADLEIRAERKRR